MNLEELFSRGCDLHWSGAADYKAVTSLGEYQRSRSRELLYKYVIFDSVLGYRRVQAVKWGRLKG